MTAQRYLDAIVTYQGPPGAHGGVSVMIPLADDAPDTPAVMHDPMPGLPGTWRRETPDQERPARYVRIDDESSSRA